MSAYIVSKAHIDAIVTFAVGGTRRVGTVKRLTEDNGHGDYVSSSDYTPNQIGANYWFGELAPASIFGLVFYDDNGNGIY